MAEEFSQPGVSTTVVDESVVDFVAPAGEAFLQVFSSSRGPDNVIVTVGSEDEALKIYGEPSIRKYGQPYSQMLEFLRPGTVQGMAMRVLPDEAVLAHVGLAVQHKLEGGLLKVRPVTVSAAARATSETALRDAAVATLPDTIDGYNVDWLFTVYPRVKGRSCRGGDYNGEAVRIVLRDDLDATFDFRTYDLSFMVPNAAGTLEVEEGPFLVSFSPDARDISGQSLFIEDVVNRASAYRALVANPAAIRRVMEAVTATKADWPKVDVVFFQERETEVPETIHGSVRVTNPASLTHAAIVNSDEAKRVAQSTLAGSLVAVIQEASDDVEAGTYDTDAGGRATARTAALGTLPTPSAGTLEKYYADMGTAVGTAAKAVLANNIINFASAQRNVTHTSLAYGACLVPGNSNIANANAAGEAEWLAWAGIEATRSLRAGLLADNNLNDAALVSANSGTDLDAKLDACDDVMVTTNALNSFSSSISTATDADLTTALTNYSLAVAALAAARTATPGTKAAKVSTAVTAVQTASTTAEAASLTNLNEAEVAAATEIYTQFKAFINGTVNVLNAAVALSKSTDPQKAVLVATALSAADEAANRAAGLALLTQDYNLQDWALPALLRGGSDGSADPEGDQATVDAFRLDYYTRAFRGLLDPTILDTDMLEIDACYDAGYPASVKRAAEGLTNSRQDFLFHADTGFTSSSSAALAFRRDELNVSNYHTAIFTQDFVVEVPAEGRDYRVTANWFLAPLMARLGDQRGIETPVAGSDLGIFTGFKSISFVPSKPQREALYKAQVNYVERDVADTYFATQMTSQKKLSKLSDINNVRVLLKVIRGAKKLVKKKLFQFNDATTWEETATAIREFASGFNPRVLRSVTALVYANAEDLRLKRARLRLTLQFGSVIEQFRNEIIISRS